MANSILYHPSHTDGKPVKLVDNGDGTFSIAMSPQGAGSGGVSYLDQSGFTAGVSAGTPIMAEDPTTGELLIAQMSPGTRTPLVAANVTITPVESSTASAPNLITVNSAAQALAANASRKRLNMQNVGTVTIFILFGTATVSVTNFHLALPAGGTTKDGSSPYIQDIMWQGAIQACTSSANGLLSIWENT